MRDANRPDPHSPRWPAARCAALGPPLWTSIVSTWRATPPSRAASRCAGRSVFTTACARSNLPAFTHSLESAVGGAASRSACGSGSGSVVCRRRWACGAESEAPFRLHSAVDCRRGGLSRGGACLRRAQPAILTTVLCDTAFSSSLSSSSERAGGGARRGRGGGVAAGPGAALRGPPRRGLHRVRARGRRGVRQAVRRSCRPIVPLCLCGCHACSILCAEPELSPRLRTIRLKRTSRYVTERRLPDSAIDLLDEAAAATALRAAGLGAPSAASSLASVGPGQGSAFAQAAGSATSRGYEGSEERLRLAGWRSGEPWASSSSPLGSADVASGQSGAGPGPGSEVGCGSGMGSQGLATEGLAAMEAALRAESRDEARRLLQPMAAGPASRSQGAAAPRGGAAARECVGHGGAGAACSGEGGCGARGAEGCGSGAGPAGGAGRGGQASAHGSWEGQQVGGAGMLGQPGSNGAGQEALRDWRSWVAAQVGPGGGGAGACCWGAASSFGIACSSSSARGLAGCSGRAGTRKGLRGARARARARACGRRLCAPGVAAVAAGPHVVGRGAAAAASVLVRRRARLAEGRRARPPSGGRGCWLLVRHAVQPQACTLRCCEDRRPASSSYPCT